MEARILNAVSDDALALAHLHTESWRSAYRGLVPDDFLAVRAADELRRLWLARLREPRGDGQQILKAVCEGAIVGLACVFSDADLTWGARLENLHVKPAMKGQGIGWRLFSACRDWTRHGARATTMHLWVLEKNYPARAFYERQGGIVNGHQTSELAPGVVVAEVRYTFPSSATKE